MREIVKERLCTAGPKYSYECPLCDWWGKYRAFIIHVYERHQELLETEKDKAYAKEIKDNGWISTPLAKTLLMSIIKTYRKACRRGLI